MIDQSINFRHTTNIKRDGHQRKKPCKSSSLTNSGVLIPFFHRIQDLIIYTSYSDNVHRLLFFQYFVAGDVVVRGDLHYTGHLSVSNTHTIDLYSPLRVDRTGPQTITGEWQVTDITGEWQVTGTVPK